MPTHAPDRAPRHATSGRAGFTLIEILIVVFIIVLLMGMMMPMLGIIQRTTMKSRTGFILKKVDTALRQFKDEYGVYPYQAQYPDPVDAKTYPNGLMYRVGKDIDDADRANLSLDLKAVGDAFEYQLNVYGSDTGYSAPAGVVFHASYMTGLGAPDNKALLANRMAIEQNRLAVIAGNTTMHGAYVAGMLGGASTDLRAKNVLTAPKSGGRPGMATDYLRGEIDKRYVRGDDVLDAWKTPVIYICQAIPGMRATPAGQDIYNYEGSAFGMDQRCFGLGAIGFDTKGPVADELISTTRRPLLVYGGRVRLSQSDAGDGQATPAVSTFYDGGDLMHSDVRYFAAPGYESEFELWSAGPDRRFEYLRSDSANRDNMSVVPYTKRLAHE